MEPRHNGHSYSNPGNYNVKLTITDNSGQTASVSSSVLVTAAPVTSNSTFLFAVLAAAIAGVIGTLVLLQAPQSDPSQLED